MKPENKQFVVILVSTFVAFISCDLAVKWVKNELVNRRLSGVRVGMSEAEAIKATGCTPVVVTNDVKEISLQEYDSVFDLLVLQKTSTFGHTIRLESGKVVAVGGEIIVR